MLSIFSCAYWLSAFPLWENGCLCTLDVNLISGMSFANVFSDSVGCLFVLSVISFSVKKLVITGGKWGRGDRLGV